MGQVMKVAVEPSICFMMDSSPPKKRVDRWLYEVPSVAAHPQEESTISLSASASAGVSTHGRSSGTHRKVTLMKRLMHTTSTTRLNFLDRKEAVARNLLSRTAE